MSVTDNLSMNCHSGFLGILLFQLCFTLTLVLWGYKSAYQLLYYSKSTNRCAPTEILRECGSTVGNKSDSDQHRRLDMDKQFLTSFGIRKDEIFGANYMTGSDFDRKLVCSRNELSPLSKRIRHEGHREETWSYSDDSVPKLTHFIRFGPWKFQFLNYLSFLSVQRTLKPDIIILHSDEVPHGYWWRKTIEEVFNIYHHREIDEPKSVFQQCLPTMKNIKVTQLD